MSEPNDILLWYVYDECPGYFAKVWDLGFLPKFSPKIL
jgi:hypothetical protein